MAKKLMIFCTHGYNILCRNQNLVLNAGQAASDVTDLPNGSHTEADEESSAEQVNEATQAKRQLLVKVSPLAGVWGLERFGLADVNILKLIEALPGVLM